MHFFDVQNQKLGRRNDTSAEGKAARIFQLPLLAANIELPRINPEFDKKPYRYTWGIHINVPGFFSECLIKIDVETQQTKIWSPATKQRPSEPVFVATPGATEEDDGALLSVAMDASVGKSSLVVVNATTMEEMGRARMPIVMGYGFHTAWGSDSSLDSVA